MTTLGGAAAAQQPAISFNSQVRVGYHFSNLSVRCRRCLLSKGSRRPALLRALVGGESRNDVPMHIIRRQELGTGEVLFAFGLEEKQREEPVHIEVGTEMPVEVQVEDEDKDDDDDELAISQAREPEMEFAAAAVTEDTTKEFKSSYMQERAEFNNGTRRNHKRLLMSAQQRQQQQQQARPGYYSLGKTTGSWPTSGGHHRFSLDKTKTGFRSSTSRTNWK